MLILRKSELGPVQARARFHPKTYKACSIPINRKLEQLWRDLRASGKSVFVHGQGKPLHHPDHYTKEFIKILKNAEIGDASLHLLGHTFPDYLVMADIDLRTLHTEGHRVILPCVT